MTDVVVRGGYVLTAPRPPRLADEIHPGLWLGGSWELAGLLRFREVIDCTHFPDGPVLPADLDELVDRTVHAVRAGRPTLVRCALGLNRSGLVAGLAMTRLARRFGGFAVDEMRRIRSPHVLCNPAFEARVRSCG